METNNPKQEGKKMANEKKNQPADTIRLGSVRVPFWQHDGEYGPWFKAKPTRSYRDKQTGDMRDSSEFAGDDMVAAGIALIVAWVRSEEMRQAKRAELRAAERNGSTSDVIDIAQN